MVNYSQLSACQGDVDAFESDPNTHGPLTSLKNKPQQKQSRKLSASILAGIVIQCVRLWFDDVKCVLLLCAWKLAFLKSSHKYCNYVYTVAIKAVTMLRRSFLLHLPQLPIQFIPWKVKYLCNNVNDDTQQFTIPG